MTTLQEEIELLFLEQGVTTVSTSVTIDSGDTYLDRNGDLFLTKIDLKAYRRWRAQPRSLTSLGCKVEIDGNRYCLTINVSAGSCGFVRFKEINDARWGTSNPAQQRYVERAEHMLPDAILRAREHLIFERIMMLPLEERQKVGIDCDLVRYDNDDTRYRAHARNRHGNEIHVTDFGSPSSVKRKLREWAVANDLYYGGGHSRHDSPADFLETLAIRRGRESLATSNSQ